MVMMTLHFLNDVANDTESKQNEQPAIIASLKNETMCKLINRIPGSRLLILSLPGSALRTHVESLGKPRDVNKHSQSLGNFDIKRHSPSILYDLIRSVVPLSDVYIFDKALLKLHSL